jgi:hypothetical protein
LRCQIRYWVETAAKGAAKGKQRFVSQTTNPKKPLVVWNKPHPSTYSRVAAMYLDQKDHVHVWGIGDYMYPAEDARMRLMGIYDQLTETDRMRYDALVSISRGYKPQWEEWEDRINALACHIEATGADPEIENGMWKGPTQAYYLGEDPAPYVVTARNRLLNL